MVKMEMCQHNQVDISGRAMQKPLEIVQGRARVQFRTRINDDNALVVDEVSICHRKTIRDRMHLGELLSKGRRSFFAFQSSIHSSLQQLQGILHAYRITFRQENLPCQMSLLFFSTYVLQIVKGGRKDHPCFCASSPASLLVF